MSYWQLMPDLCVIISITSSLLIKASISKKNPKKTKKTGISNVEVVKIGKFSVAKVANRKPVDQIQMRVVWFGLHDIF